MGCQSSKPNIQPQPMIFDIKLEFNNLLENLKMDLNNYNKRLIKLEKEGKQDEIMYEIRHELCIDDIDEIKKKIAIFNKHILSLDYIINPYNIDVNNISKISQIEHILLKTYNTHRLALILTREFYSNSKLIKYIKLLDNIIEQCENRLKLLRK